MNLTRRVFLQGVAAGAACLAAGWVPEMPARMPAGRAPPFRMLDETALERPAPWAG